MNEVLLGFETVGVESLAFACRRKCKSAKYLGFAPRENSRSVDARKVSDLGIQWPQFVEFPTVGTDVVFQDGLAHRLGFEGVKRRFNVSRVVVVPELFDGVVHQFFDTVFAGGLVAGFLESFDEIFTDQFPCGFFSGILFSGNFGGFPLLLTDFRPDLLDLLDDGTIDFLCKFERIQEHILGNEVGSRFDHHRGVACAGDQQLKVACLQFFVCGVYDKLAFDQTNHARSDRVVERDVRYGERRGCSDYSERRVRVNPVGCQYRDDDLNFVVYRL